MGAEPRLLQGARPLSRFASALRLGHFRADRTVVYPAIGSNRRLQDQFESRRIADRLEQKLARTAFTADDKTFIESAIYFFLASADDHGQPDCSFKGGPAGFVRVTGPNELATPDYDGNGMFKS